jgi:hypothetical protein
LPQLSALLLNALAAVPAPLGTDKPVRSALESFAADNAVPFRQWMLGAVALSPLAKVRAVSRNACSMRREAANP